MEATPETPKPQIESLSSNSSFIHLASSGKNEWWRYLLTTGMVVWLVITSTVIILVPLMLKYGTTVGAAELGEPLWLAVNLAPFPFAIVGLWLGLRWMHKRSFRTILAVGKFRWGAAAASCVFWLFVSALGDLILAALQPGNYNFSFDLTRYLPYALVVLLMIPWQIAAEELVFRGYLAQAFGRLGGFWLAWIVPSVIFAMLHGANPEVGQYGVWLTMPSYLGIGLLMGWLTLKTGGLEMALGLHLANNLYTTLLVTFPSSALPSPALWQITTLHPAASLTAFFGATGVYLLLIWLFRRNLFSPRKS